ncbi:MAG TPA: 50S ribosomal protein L32 [bacterium]|nr:50S ribosomal protein L32 [bacterium]HPJ71218.1 50S ribosomal protein L32 [bacterium]HPQ66092.1 50S ribosomal protein L32 [bacterium]
MAVPKRRTSKSKKRMRRSPVMPATPSISECPHCRSPKESHRVCPHCGYYKGKIVVQIEEA